MIFLLVDLRRFELPTPAMRMRCAPNCATSPLFSLIPENNFAGGIVHRFHNGQTFQVITQIPNHVSTDLETLFDYDAQTFNGGTGAVGNGDQTLQGAAVGQKIVNDQQVGCAKRCIANDSKDMLTMHINFNRQPHLI